MPIILFRKNKQTKRGYLKNQFLTKRQPTNNGRYQIPGGLLCNNNIVCVKVLITEKASCSNNCFSFYMFFLFESFNCYDAQSLW